MSVRGVLHHFPSSPGEEGFAFAFRMVRELLDKNRVLARMREVGMSVQAQPLMETRCCLWHETSGEAIGLGEG
jgi:hypothetical protein